MKRDNLCVACGVAAACCAANAVGGDGPSIRLTIDAKDRGAVISPLLFGHNLEVTRRAVWSGLSAEMVANRKFAAAENARPKQWQPVGGENTVSVDTSVAYAGTQSVRIDVTAPGTVTGIRQQHAVLAVSEGKSYGYRLWLKTGHARRLSVRLTGEANRTVFEKTFSCKPGDWRLLRGTFASSVTQTNCTLEIASTDGGTYWLGAVSLQASDSFHGMRRDVIELLKQIRPGGLRFPGGCYAEFYRWKDGLLPVDQRPPIGPTGLNFLLPQTDDYDTHEIGIDEFMALCREVGAAPAITIRMSETEPEDGAAWVEYCNGSAQSHWGRIRTERGHRKPYGVKTWFLGNELYSFGRGGLNDANICATQTKRFAEAVRRVDASVHLVGCTALVCGNNNMTWNQPLMEQAGSLFSHVSAHDYLRDSARPQDLPSYAAAATTHLRPAFDRFRSVPNRPVLLDEWNTYWGQPGTVGMALCAAGVLNLLAREGEELAVKAAYFFQPITEGAITVTPLSAKLDTVGEVFDLFQVHQGNRQLALAGTPPLDLCASLTPDGGRIYVTVVNASLLEQGLTLQLADGTIARGDTATVRHLTPHALEPTETALDRRDEQVPIMDGNRLTVNVPPCGIARVAVEIRKM